MKSSSMFALLIATPLLSCGQIAGLTNTAPGATNPPRPSPDALLQRGAKQTPATWPGDGWKPLFNGKTLAPWHVSDFAGHGEVGVEHGLLVLNQGGPFTGIGMTNPPFQLDYEIALEAMRVKGSDFFCGLTVPVGTNHCSLIVGGWGGGVTGISSLDGYDASENETTKFLDYETGRWYRIRFRVTGRKLEAWIDDQKVVNVVTEDRRIAVRAGEIEESLPLGIACYSTTTALRNVQWRKVDGPDTKK